MSKNIPVSGSLLSLFRGYEELHTWEDKGAGIIAIIAIHNTNLGPALGGCRRALYPAFQDAFVDVARLSRGMTYKAAMTDYYNGGLPLGGGKSVMVPMRQDKRLRKQQFASMGRFVETLAGRYIIAEDVGTYVPDVHEMRKFTKHACGEMVGHPYGGDPSPLTALGVLAGMKGALRAAFGSNALEGRSVYVEGIGKVGFPLMQLLHKEGALLYVSNRSVTEREVEALLRAQDEYGAKVVRLTEDGKAERFPDVEIYAPCAMGGTVGQDLIAHFPPSLSIIAGSANNVLFDPAVDGASLLLRRIVYAPDYVINNRGLWDVYCQRLHEQGTLPYDLKYVEDGCLQNEALIEEIIHRSEGGLTRTPTNVVADRMAEAVFMKKEMITHT
ncbi:MAG: hypothetical protein A2845_05615 [Candidatus Lloydbacteria bacterium RIFCSPHIGHO2_01_FULL_49_22]|uniref:Glutamate/phenylalanine/leucine/valine/L-tryptophan dehydrogenase C-terminal domain-containing protein n=1 Tax=Candidatus Lloydbacteria bacterium RIFCSPHIGHO2_01_FULL_49_22 TaxID=1798658 RepID=A0A1G2CTV6_9BACT|nr:MAG: hypothetical protein A2845_05615 [Candidatus Lloydbacteria bacterium RIFCSPHIGHO2_01_FULL_49_22]OGZ09684.1 MAG: hypothetical protein A3C14_02925 [Candidatus Lloydbacteria bacterium RIFCSPHIGHO2_02_FULL_50_18]